MSEKKFLNEQQIDSLSFPEPPMDFADRVMGAVLQPAAASDTTQPKKPSSSMRGVLGAGLIAASFASGVLVSPMLISTKEPKPLQLQAITPTSQTNPQPTGGTMSSGYTTLGALSLLAAFFGPLGPLADPNPTQTKKFCKEAVASCEESPEALCESVWELCLEKPKKKETRVDPSKAPKEPVDEQAAIKDLREDIDGIAEELDACYQEKDCSEQELKELKEELKKGIKTLQEKMSKLGKETPDLASLLFPPEAPKPLKAPLAPLPPTAPIAPKAPKAPRPPVAPNWGDSAVIIRDAGELEECEECERELSIKDALQREKERIEKYLEELEMAIDKYDDATEKKKKGNK